jgi:integrase
MSDSQPTAIDRRQKSEATRYPGVNKLHARGCPAGRACRCKPTYRASVYSAREGKKLRKVFAGEKEAKTWREDTAGAVRDGRKQSPSKQTVREAADAFLAGARDGSIPAAGGGRYKPATLRGYTVGLNKRVLPKLGHLRLSDVQRRDVQDLADRLTSEGLSASTVQNTLDPLRVIFRRAIRREEGVSVDPTKGLELRRPDGFRDRIASPVEAAELLAALDDEDRPVWATAMYAGLRRGELMALRWSDVDLAAKVIRVQRGWDAIEGEQEGKSAAANRRVPILDVLAPILDAHFKRGDRVADALVFGATEVKPFTPESVRRRALAAWRAENERRIEAADDPADVELLSPITLHEARHTCASVLIAAGVNAKALSVIMGHATITMTFDRYGHLMPNGIDDAAAAANAYLARNAGGRALTVVGA